MSNDKNNSVATFLMGAAIGVAAGILLAPYAGEDARKKLIDKANDLKDQFGSSLADVFNTAREKVSEYGEKAENAANNFNKRNSDTV
ncbi:MAG: YtxH domain-containing protein [Bacteroidota bacterium]